ncbi:hypothetical protein CON65_23390 [Bacillus pseudomycoides]|uniref:Group-specific protein n=1 Tax=Bacillus pseudomycoides TaxID=64104 RepID=A0AA91V842_9BACI|nr:MULTISPECIES: hypothetical protein [Bacillus]PEB56076.1 hypothetical protein COO03_01700 [Bacillus sp. AFS098217]PED80286.1 hypothetical protein CON65_23390 [Bacillus pseudomycoides]PEU10176.1 hypothetical protein CN525_23955 [Bacillus sp. AFS014408]PEU18009.1 hypothetical protein CN524_00390 [Bacillus sp. AFS019443]PFW61224.1 hypothetical protein COL20_18580 [Bacillus sp. AFS075034]
MFYNNQQSYPHQPYYPQDQEQQYQEQLSENQEQETQHQELQYSQNPYVTQQTQETRYQQNPYVTQQTQETQHQQNPYVAQQTQEARYQQNPYVTQHVPETQHQQNPYVAQQTQEVQQAPYQQPQMYQPYHDPRVSPPAPTLDSTQPQTLPTGSTTGIPTEPTEQQIQQVVGTQFLSLKKPILDFVKPWVEYGMNEAKYTSPQHAMTEVAAIMFLVGKGFNPTIAHYIVESWEKNEQF